MGVRMSARRKLVAIKRKVKRTKNGIMKRTSGNVPSTTIRQAVFKITYRTDTKKQGIGKEDHSAACAATRWRGSEKAGRRAVGGG